MVSGLSELVQSHLSWLNMGKLVKNLDIFEI